MIRSLFAFSLLALSATCALAQVGQPPVRKWDGIALLNDSAYTAVFKFRMQDRVAVLHHNLEHGTMETYEFMVRRLRLKLEGHVVDPRLEYKLQFGLANGDMDIGDGQSHPSPLLDVMVYYQLFHHTRVGLGEGKQPGGRQSITSSGLLELPERPLANKAFTIDRDLGVVVEQRVPAGRGHFDLWASVSQGEGRAPQPGNRGLCYTGRAEWSPLGAFMDNGAYSEGDLVREQTPKLALAAAFSFNQNARRTRGQQGPYFTDGAMHDIATLYADAILKYRGLSWSNDYFQRWLPNPTGPGAEQTNQGWGGTSELAKMIGPRSQLVLRYSLVRPEGDARTLYHDHDEAVLGYNLYLNGHRVKLQCAAVYQALDGKLFQRHAGNSWGGVVQIEVGI